MKTLSFVVSLFRRDVRGFTDIARFSVNRSTIDDLANFTVPEIFESRTFEASTVARNQTFCSKVSSYCVLTRGMTSHALATANLNVQTEKNSSFLDFLGLKIFRFSLLEENSRSPALKSRVIALHVVDAATLHELA